MQLLTCSTEMTRRRKVMGDGREVGEKSALSRNRSALSHEANLIETESRRQE